MRRHSLTQFLIERQRAGRINADLRLLIETIARACKAISTRVNKGALGGGHGSAGSENVQGEIQKNLDVMSNEILLEANEWGGNLAALVSEEMEDVKPTPTHYPRGEYLLLFDPLDGSSNIDVNVPVGTIFSVVRKITRGRHGEMEDLLQPGRRQVAAGYIIYGSSTMLVYTTGQGVHGFTLDPSIGEFLLSHPNIRIPDDGRYLSVNDSYEQLWDENVKTLMRRYRGLEGGAKALSVRYVGSLVADFHRNLLGGGIFAYPANRKSPKGKLRLLYEANPLGFIVEQAGGAASDGSIRVLDVLPTELHQRTPLYIGSKSCVEMAKECVSGVSQLVGA
jgi:fructose-1,6-bisphosphatase I